jgi:short-subunit dehydrogenase
MWLLAFFVALIAAVVFYGEQKTFIVHKEGIVLITGASTGIGRHAAEYIADNFNYLVLAGVRKESDALNIDGLKKNNLKSLIIDVSSHDSCLSAIAQVKEIMSERKLPFVALVNNAGVSRYAPIEFQDLDDARTLFNTNFFGALDLAQLTLPMLRESKGRLIQISSMAGFITPTFSGLYSSSKFAMEAMSDALRREVSDLGVSVSVIQPGYVNTPIVTSSKIATGDFISSKWQEIQQIYPKVQSRESAEARMEAAVGPDTSTTPAIVDALTAASPRARYRVAGALGLSADVVSWLVWAMTDRLRDLLL